MITVNEKQQLVKKLLHERQHINTLEKRLRETHKLLDRLNKSEEERKIYLNRMRHGLLVLDDQQSNRHCESCSLSTFSTQEIPDSESVMAMARSFVYK